MLEPFPFVVTAVHNEQTKLLATALNNVAVAYVVIGFVTPMTAASFGVASAPAMRIDNAVFTIVWLCTGCALHYAARRALRSMKP